MSGYSSFCLRRSADVYDSTNRAVQFGGQNYKSFSLSYF